MDEQKYGVLLKALKACEKNYHSHTREFGKLDKTDISFWADQLSDFTPERLERSFSEHIKTSSFFPTVKDIREGTPENPKRKPCEDHKYLDSLNESRLLTGPERAKLGMPDRMKEIFHKLQLEVANANN